MAETDSFIVVVGCFDTKGEDFSFLCECLREQGERVKTINTGVMGTTELFPVDIEADAVASRAGSTLAKLREQADRGEAVKTMGKGAREIVEELVGEGTVKAAVGMGGGAGTYIALSALQAVPLGIPKLCISTMAGTDLSRQIQNKDIILVPSVVDVAGLNRISRRVIRQSAAALSAMANVPVTDDRTTAGSIAISMFGNTNACVNQCRALLEERGYEVFAFHANGVGGQTMESLIREGVFDAVLDVTTTELADDLCGGVCSAGPERLRAAAEMGIPQVVAPGCLDMVNFAQMDTVPEKYQSRQLYSWAPSVTLMRTSDKENRVLGERLAQKLNRSTAAATVLLPLRGISQVDAEGEVFYQPEINQVLFEAIKTHVQAPVTAREVDAHINDPSFAQQLVTALTDLIDRK